MDLIIKLLNLSQSDNDHEALSAIRKVNAILKHNKISWASLISKPATGQDILAQQRAQYEANVRAEQRQREKREEKQAKEELGDMFDFILGNAPDWFDADFVEDLKFRYDHGEDLSLNQLNALKRIYKMATRRF